jgi:hypothetical protein
MASNSQQETKSRSFKTNTEESNRPLSKMQESSRSAVI